MTAVVTQLFPPPALEPGVARWPKGEPLPEEWFSTDRPDLDCQLCGDVVTRVWPLLHYPPDPDFGLVDGEWLICERCADAVRP